MEQQELNIELQEHRETQREKIIFKTLRHAMNALALRGLRFLALVFSATAFGVAIAEPDPARIVAASLFAVLVFLPILFRAEGPNANG